jgi:hypothetical protein
VRERQRVCTLKTERRESGDDARVANCTGKLGFYKLERKRGGKEHDQEEGKKQ